MKSQLKSQLMRWTAAIVAAAAVLVLGDLGTALAHPSGEGEHRAPRDDTIVEITGDRVSGFAIAHYDGTSTHPPTGSEAKAECGEYDARVARVRCRTEARVWYRELGRTKRALAWARHAS